MSTDNCVMCGDIIPEGRQVCPNCETKITGEKPNICLSCLAAVIWEKSLIPGERVPIVKCTSIGGKNAGCRKQCKHFQRREPNTYNATDLKQYFLNTGEANNDDMG